MMLSCGEIYPEEDMSRCISMCRSTLIPNTGAEDLPSDFSNENRVISIQKPGNLQECHNFKINAGKRGVSGLVGEFRAGIYRIKAGGCSGDNYLAQIDLEQNQKTLDFTINIQKLIETGHQELCVVKEDGSVCQPEDHWFSNVLRVEEAGCSGQERQSSGMGSDLSPKPRTTVPPSGCLSEQGPSSNPCVLGEVLEHETGLKASRLFYCRAAEEPDTTWPEPIIDLRLLEAGSYLQGSPQEEEGREEQEGPQHQVEIAPLWIADKELSRRSFWLLSGDQVGWKTPCLNDAEGCPMAGLNWWSALLLLNRLSEAQGLPPCYELRGCRDGFDQRCPLCDQLCEEVIVQAEGGDPRLCQGYRLATESEWEYAARGGQSSARYGPLDEIAQHRQGPQNLEDDPHSLPGGSLRPNAYGLYDMLGNLWEMLWDRLISYSGEEGFICGPSQHGIRGGSYRDSAELIRAAYRVCISSTWRGHTVGFRVARSFFPLVKAERRGRDKQRGRQRSARGDRRADEGDLQR